MLGELRAVAGRARSLTDVPPARRSLARRRGRDRCRAATRASCEMRPARRFSFTLPQLVAASLALMVLSGGMVWIARLGGERTDFPSRHRVGTSRFAGSPLPATFAEAHYDEAIADLQQTLEAERAKLDPETVRVLEQNLAAIDSAIEQCRRALEADPVNRYLTDHLVAAKEEKAGAAAPRERAHQCRGTRETGTFATLR